MIAQVKLIFNDRCQWWERRAERALENMQMKKNTSKSCIGLASASRSISCVCVCVCVCVCLRAAGVSGQVHTCQSLLVGYNRANHHVEWAGTIIKGRGREHMVKSEIILCKKTLPSPYWHGSKKIWARARRNVTNWTRRLSSVVASVRRVVSCV